MHAAKDLQQHLRRQSLLDPQTFPGKMFGVLVVWSPKDQKLGYLAAFSGNLPLENGQLTNHYPGFVPPVYDLLAPDGFFKVEEQEISELHHQWKTLKEDIGYLEKQQEYEHLLQDFEAAAAQRKQVLRAHKARRDRQRAEVTANPSLLEALIRESQQEKADYKRWEKSRKCILDALQQQIRQHEAHLGELRQERNRRSIALEQKIFQAFRLTNGQGAWSSVFHLAPHAPGGTGECAAPKLLHHAWLHQYRPIALAEFWWGKSPRQELRFHGNFYPACRGKCGLILPFLLKGLKVQATPSTAQHTLEILWEDEAILAINKPSGCLSLPGNDGTLSAMELLQEQNRAPLFSVHRLDRDTSGLLLFAKTPEAQRLLQAQFRARQVRKEYIAILEKHPEHQQGKISLPLAPDWIHRPRQQVDPQKGKIAITEYHLLSSDQGHPRVLLIPHTGRTHQLRVHTAHPLGLDAPILGDPLYGRCSDDSGRLLLHASRITFMHPRRQVPVTLFCLPPF